ncbi:MAG TPA: class I SAM-dependent methyltransferase [Acidimicrobiales bacterium]|nr:class I SAM-dependent methyltransferase [Acidimicrobiales bacterium]
MAPDTDGQPDVMKTALFALQVWKYKEGEVLSLMIHLGDRLGLYRAMAGRGPMSAAALSAATGLRERWLLEWLRSQAAASLLDSPDGDEFELSPEAAEVLVEDTESLFFAAGAFQGGVAPPEVVDRLADAFRTGIGLSYDDLGPSAAHTVERMLGPWSRLALVPVVLPALEGVVGRLTGGARVADVGCGSGVALFAMAAAFPDSRFEGYDPSEHAIDRARAKLAEGTQPARSNLEFHRAGAVDLPGEPTYDLVLTLDCLHDMPHPAEALAAIRRSINDDGTLLVKDIRAGVTWEENQHNPLLALMYGTSVATCVSSALSEPDGAGLGTLGLHPELAEEMCREAGFTRFTLHDFEEPANLYYEVRP